MDNFSVDVMVKLVRRRCFGFRYGVLRLDRGRLVSYFFSDFLKRQIKLGNQAFYLSFLPSSDVCGA